MEAAAWLAVTKFGCKLEGGFVRDWIVDSQHVGRPRGRHMPGPRGSDVWKTEGSGSWVWLRPEDGVPEMEQLLTPADLDLHLPLESEFALDDFVKAISGLGVSVDYVLRQGWRYALVLDLWTETGPFCMDLIEPHVAMAHDMIDLDVNNLFVSAGYTNALGMRVNLSNASDDDRVSLSLETVVRNIREKKYVQLQAGSYAMERRMQKMNSRGWTKVDELRFVPNR